MTVIHLRSPRLLLAGLAATLAVPAFAQFTGVYGFPDAPPDVYYINADQGVEFGIWTLETTLDGATPGFTEGALWLNQLPDEIQLQAHASTAAGAEGPVTFTNSLSFNNTQPLQVSFSISVTQQGNATGGFYYGIWQPNGDRIDSAVFTGTHDFSVYVPVDGDLTFFSFASDLTLADGDHSFTSVQISNFSVAVVPEPSSFAAFAGLGALAFSALRRRRSIGGSAR